MLSRRDLPLRIIVDYHHDTGWRDARSRLGGGPLQVTICRDRLKWSVLRRYHVLIIDACTPTRFSAAELAAIERFVVEGGGLLLASSAPTFELMTGRPAAKLPANAVAARFGFHFLAPAQCRAETRHDRDFRLGYPPDQVSLSEYAPEGLGPHPPGVGTWAPIAMPDDAVALFEHPRTAEPLAGLAHHGAGRVCVFAAHLNHMNLLTHLYPLLDQLCGEPTERPGREIPAEIGPTPRLIDDGRLRMIYDEALVHRTDEIGTVVQAFNRFMADLFGEHWRMPTRIEVRNSCLQPDVWDDSAFFGAACPGWALAWNVALGLGLAGLKHRYAGRLLVTLFPELTLLRHLAIRFVEHQGFTEVADRLRGITQAQMDRMDPDRTGTDLARVYWATGKWHPKGMWLLDELERRYGDDFLRRLFEILPAAPADEKLPARFAWPSDKVVYYLSLAAGEDLSDWLHELGTTVHSLPLTTPDHARFADAMREALVEGATTGPASRRIEALADLAALGPDERAKLPGAVSRLVSTFERAGASDRRAVAELRRLLRRKDETLAAIAALQLLSMGEADAADRLAELAPRQDVRFRLMAGHALRRVGRNLPELSLPGLVENGRRIGELDVAVTDTLAIHPRVAGYEVANVICAAGVAGFPHGNRATQLYVEWVHTSPQWRRAGLSRLAFATALQHPEAQRCSCFALNTGTRNNAHAMYRDFGFIDVSGEEEALKSLALGTPCVPPDGIVLRPLADEDRDRVRRFLLACRDDVFTTWPLPIPVLAEGTQTVLAEKDGTLIGAAVARHDENGHARLLDVCVAPQADHRAEVGVALLARLHQLLADDGARTVRARIGTSEELLPDILARAGYSRRLTGSVTMFGIRDLRQLFEEIGPLYERRLADADLTDWCGRVIIIGERLCAGLEIEGGRVEVTAPRPRATDIILRTGDEAVTRFVTGRETPLEGYLQRTIDIAPQVNSSVIKLLEGLFPRCPFLVRWGW